MARSMEINTWSQRAVLPGGAGLTASRDNKLLELLSLCPGPSREWGLIIPYSSKDMGDLTSSGGSSMKDLSETRRHHTDTTLDLDFQA